MLSQVRIVGAGLIGTSIALGLSARGLKVLLSDSDLAAARLANDLAGGGELDSPELVILALPTAAIPMVIEAEFALNPDSTFIDVGSVKSEVIRHINQSSLPLTQFVPTHPMAGREIGGAQSARADLFATRSWVLTPTPECGSKSLALAHELIHLLGASAVILSADDHDRAAATISHVPQIAASLVAQSLSNIPAPWLELSGQGLRDTTRIATSDPYLWSEIIFSNRSEISTVLKSLHNDLGSLIESIDDQDVIEEFIARGASGRALIPGKHGGKAREYTYLPIVINDKPGQLAAIFNECAVIDVNVEDLSIEHSPGQLSALITLALSSTDAAALSRHLAGIGWNVHPVLK